MLAQIYLSKAAGDPFSNMDKESAIEEAQKVLGAASVPDAGEVSQDTGSQSKPATRAEAEALIRARTPKPANVSDEVYEAAIQKLLNEKY